MIYPSDIKTEYEWVSLEWTHNPEINPFPIRLTKGSSYTTKPLVLNFSRKISLKIFTVQKWVNDNKFITIINSLIEEIKIYYSEINFKKRFSSPSLSIIQSLSNNPSYSS
jgi:hypothetical protein